MSNDITRFDKYLTNASPAALVIREYLVPVEGPDGVLFPPTFASGDGFPGGYNIDGETNGEKIALIDTVGAQSNRIEPMFTEPGYAELVPQVVIKAGAKSVNLLQASHRAGDAIVRCTLLQVELEAAFNNLLDGDATALAKIAPTSLVFGVWDSRKTQAKMPRLVASTIRAYNVRRLTRHAQFNPAMDYVAEGILTEPEDLRDSEGKVIGKHPFAQRGFTHVPITKKENTHGGVIADGGIRRDATLALAALSLIKAGSDKEATKRLQRYILGLALVAFTRLPGGYIRQGTLLVSDNRENKGRKAEEVYPNGKREPFCFTHDQALEFAKEAAKEFGVGPTSDQKKDKPIKFEKDKEGVIRCEVFFDAKLAEADLKEAKGATKPKKPKKGEVQATAPTNEASSQ
ncbi:MAG: type I-U CRISPR-associated RAMP protein Csb1/Cas7u [Limisphaerales bacterium]